MKQPELLVPAGNIEKLRTAINYGADAVYVGGEHFGLRALAGNFSLADLRLARTLTQDAGKRLYLTLNAYLRPSEFPALEAYLAALQPLAIDAYIVSDPGVLATVRRCAPQREIHLSTQANTGNAAAAKFWREAGVSRINLAREATLDDLRAISADSGVEVEVFVHGAMCVAYSGRCLLSAAMTGRSANAGACAHPCRWKYALVEETRPAESFPIEEDARGTYIMNSRDLCLIDHLPEVLSAGATSLKIEGRMKSVYYVAVVSRVYRAALDAWRADPATYRCNPLWRQELEKVSHRPYASGFLFGQDDPLIEPQRSGYLRSTDFIGMVESVSAEGRALVIGRNRFFPGEQLELIGPALRQSRFTVATLHSEEGTVLTVGQPNARIVMTLPSGARSGDILRRDNS
ncbi:MAG: U32 family peptidase [Desulfuromonadales bacterium]|nr:U32 family peptidase [Desulfuromonadales bacterium]